MKFTPKMSLETNARRTHHKGRRAVDRWAFCLLIAGMAMLPITVASAAEPTLDDMLEIGGAATQPAQPTSDGTSGAATKPVDPAAGPAIDPREARRALEQEERQAGDAFRKAVSEMYQVSERIGKKADTSREIQRDQEEIVRKLDQVIEAAEKSQGKGSSSSSSGKPKSRKENGNEKNQQGQQGQPQQGQAQGSKPGQGQQQAQAGGATPGMGTGPGGGVGITTPMAELRERWGNLPGRVREQLMQGVQEKVSPVYREWTEQYYKRLAEDQP